MNNPKKENKKVKTENFRTISLNCLTNILYNEKLLHEELNVYRSNAISEEEKKQLLYAERIVKGVVEKIDEIDNIVAKYSKTAKNKIHKRIFIILRIAMYELLYMNSIPSYATINEAGKMVKKLKLNGLLPFVNGILRNVDRECIKGTETEKEIISYQKNEHLKTNYNIKEDVLLEDSRIYFRINDIKNSESIFNSLVEKNILLNKYDGSLDFKYYKVYSCKNIKELINTIEFKTGRISIQDASGIYLCEKIFEYAKSKMLILDCCACPGGKSFGLYHLIKQKELEAKFVLRDKSISKINILKENAKRENVANTDIQVYDATEIKNKNLIEEEKLKFDIVICDVPCSGLGVIKKKKDIALHTTKEKVLNLQKIQRQIIQANILKVKPNGIFSYSTCTLTKEENEDNCKFILKKFPNAKLLLEKKINIDDENKCDGFYFCIFSC